jgi:hypothetical protein
MRLRESLALFCFVWIIYDFYRPLENNPSSKLKGHIMFFVKYVEIQVS